MRWVFRPTRSSPRTSEVGTDLRAVRVCGGLALRRSMPADLALSEKSPHLEGAWVRWIFRPPRCSPRTSEVGTDLRAVRVCGGLALRRSMPADLALSEKSPHPGGVQARWIFRPPRCSPRTSEVGTDLRAVRSCRNWHYKRTCPILRSSQNMPSPREDPNSLPNVLAARSTYRSTQLFP